MTGKRIGSYLACFESINAMVEVEWVAGGGVVRMVHCLLESLKALVIDHGKSL